MSELGLSADQRDLARMARAFFAEHTDLNALLAETVPDPLWTDQQLKAAGDLGLASLLAADGGGTHTDLAVVVEQLGHTGSALPVGTAALAVGLAEAAGISSAGLGECAAGLGLATVVAAEPGAPELSGKPSGDGGLVLSGRADFVPAGAAADYFLVLARTAEGGAVLAVLDAGFDGLTVTQRGVLDISRRFSSVELESVLVGAGDWVAGEQADAAFALARDAVAVHAAADALGASARLLEMTLEHVRTRAQFGRAVGSFQAVKHHCATMAADLELSRAVVLAAMRALDGEPDARAEAVSAAASFAGEACSRVASLALQLHGGMGFTWEQQVHVFLRRAKTDELLAGTPRWHRDRLLKTVEPAR
ncbi:acyl-CoA dehydrogenase family protein [Amycolatopsis sp.]|uniref:acyl-CoA dehydrogenase family protein n=1 Tax=Amycolatopsis sp. TaxID=37632 RepID=UPI002B8A9167|nr:acyl-CoA dehydrogenase family protein [Amycolatopsis sp.]HVV10510.1 acyl-CoA dehydrogenase family protein [Amycolatopsis sp.]